MSLVIIIADTHARHHPVPFLPVREEFHPKRNQARQKLATLPNTRFEDLSSDVYYELARRYPEFTEDVRIFPVLRPYLLMA
jgi:Spa2 homology domain (SHD) of GIT